MQFRRSNTHSSEIGSDLVLSGLLFLYSLRTWAFSFRRLRGGESLAGLVFTAMSPEIGAGVTPFHDFSGAQFCRWVVVYRIAVPRDSESVSQRFLSDLPQLGRLGAVRESFQPPGSVEIDYSIFGSL